jgi:hypothetical protein
MTPLKKLLLWGSAAGLAGMVLALSGFVTEYPCACEEVTEVHRWVFLQKLVAPEAEPLPADESSSGMDDGLILAGSGE